eukprot:scaffold32351_cov60-Attheya_sp.AAC.7
MARFRLSIFALGCLIQSGQTFTLKAKFSSPNKVALGGRTNTHLFAAPAESDFEQPRTVSDRLVDANRYNIPLDEAAELWTASVQQDKSATRAAGVPYLDCKSKDCFVDDLENVQVFRKGGLGMELLEIAGGRDDGLGITIVSAVTKGGNAERAGILPGDSIASLSVISSEASGNSIQETERVAKCECLDFDSTIQVLTTVPGNDATCISLGIKRIRRWPKVQVRVEYPKSQCAEGVSNVRDIELFAGENLRRAMLNRGIIMDDPEAQKCDFCGTKCVVSVSRGMRVLNPIGTTEEKLMENNPTCREGEVQLRVNIRQW